MTTSPLVEKLQKILALTNSPVEGEAQAAAAMLSKLLAQHNLSIADLEGRGQAAPGIREEGYDLGKAAFRWKLDLAEAIADHYFCFSIVSRGLKTVAFVGRPENVESLQMLYGWLIDQIKRISADERRAWMTATGEHMDPLRWQVNFGVGAVQRLATRLADIRAEQQSSAGTALVVHHQSEISDYLEERYGYRRDGGLTKEQRARRERSEQMQRDMAADRAMMTDEQYWSKYPWERPLSPEQAAKRAKELAAEFARAQRNARRRTGRVGPRVDNHKEDQRYEAWQAGRAAGGRVNLSPFLEGGSKKGGSIG